MPTSSYDYDTDSDGDADSDFSMAPTNFQSIGRTTATSRTSLDDSIRSPSPTQSVMSVTSSVRAQSYRLEHGRGVNNYCEVYRLPADEEEIARLGGS